ncbi:MAG: YqhA family protein [Leptolyngbyaceae cyanobacterium MO_188.B28]|nr:YqhA family protein [Leptolyngbyaceae cyanobacterium MO_188.B28]
MTTEFPTNPPPPKSKIPRLLRLIVWTRFLSAIAVVSSLLATVLMLLIGSQNTLKAFVVFFAEHPETVGDLEPGEEATLLLLESLDNFLVGLAFLYFAYGIYSLFISLNPSIPEFIPQWLKVSNIATLKKTLLELLVVLLSVVFVKGLLETVSTTGLHWDFLVIPLSIVAIALSIRLMNLGETE